MAKTQEYMDYLDEKIGIAPANSQEEYQASELIANLMSEHGLDTSIQEFDSHGSGTGVRDILSIVLFVSLIAEGLAQGILHVVLLLVAISSAGILIFMHFVRNPFTGLGPSRKSQNVIGFKRAENTEPARGSRPIIIVAHYDTPRENVMRKGTVSRYQPILTRIGVLCPAAVAVTLLFQILMFLPEPFRMFMWVAGMIFAVPALVLAVTTFISGAGVCTLGANDNKSGVAALLSLVDRISPAEDAAQRAAGARQLEAAAAHIKENTFVEPKAQRKEIVEEVIGVRHGEETLRSLGILPASCQITYEEPRVIVIEEPKVEVPQVEPEVLPAASALAPVQEKESFVAEDDTSYEEKQSPIEEPAQEPEKLDYEFDGDYDDEFDDDYDDGYDDDYEDDLEDDYDDEESEEEPKRITIRERIGLIGPSTNADENSHDSDDDYDKLDESEGYDDEYEDDEYDDDYIDEEDDEEEAPIGSSIGSWFSEKMQTIRGKFGSGESEDEGWFDEEDETDEEPEEEQEDVEDDVDDYEDDEEYFEDEEDEESEDDDYLDEDSADEEEYDLYYDEDEDDDESYDNSYYEEKEPQSDYDDNTNFELDYDDKYEYEQEYRLQPIEENQDTYYEDDESEYEDEEDYDASRDLAYDAEIEEDEESDFEYEEDEEPEDDFFFGRLLRRRKNKKAQEDEEDLEEELVEDEEYEDYEEYDSSDELEDEDEDEVEDEDEDEMYYEDNTEDDEYYDDTDSDESEEYEDEEEEEYEDDEDDELYDDEEEYEEEPQEKGPSIGQRLKNLFSRKKKSDSLEESDEEYEEYYDEDEELSGEDEELYDEDEYYGTEEEYEEEYEDEEYDGEYAEEEYYGSENHRLADPKELHLDREEEDDDILPRDDSGITKFTETYDLYEGEVQRESRHERPAAVEDPSWGTSSYTPTRPSMNIARRAVLYDLPDPSGATVDPLANEYEYEEEVVATQEEAEQQEISRGGFWNDNSSRGGRSRDWKGGATLRDDLRGDYDVQNGELQDAMLELGDEFLNDHDIWFVATGASSEDHAGMKAFIDENRRDVRGAFLINLECVGAGSLATYVREGISNQKRADRRLVNMISEICRDLHIGMESAMCDWGETDAASAMRARIRSITIIGLNDSDLPALSQTADDVPENVNPEQVDDVVRIVTEVIRRA